ncbi:hypothetical protein PG993_013248 [Apiospora rasikravindrae]|uniref:Uncharacterized protein n=1 Tax=Apiospora rasikravindrae TaxID=990691 RepID=A0ABR1RX34_9PEZI
MIKTDPILEDMSPGRSLPSERSHMAKPQIFVHLEFGVSWSQRHTPRTHAVTYTSRNLRDARDRGAFPRQLPPTNTNYLATLHQQQWQREIGEHRQQARQHYQQHQQQPQYLQPYHHPQNHTQQPGYNNTPAAQQDSRGLESQWARDSLERSQETTPDGQRNRRRESRSESRGLSHERGSSAPPPLNDSPWDATTGASLFPPPKIVPAATSSTSRPRQNRTQEEPRIWKPLPEAPGRFRLGEDGLPWSAFAWPVDPHGPDEDQGEPDYANQSTHDMSSGRSRVEDPAKAMELESLSAAMMTVDNGFESQWWYQGPREPVPRLSRDQEEPQRLSMADAVLLNTAEPMVSTASPMASAPPPEGWYAPTTPQNDGYDQFSTYDGNTFGTTSESIGGIVSPISTLSASPQQYRPLHRTLTTRSEELFFGH